MRVTGDKTGTIVAGPPVPPRRAGNSAGSSRSQTSTASESDGAEAPPPVPVRMSGMGGSMGHGDLVEEPHTTAVEEVVPPLFTASVCRNYFTKVFNECPLNILHAAFWVHPQVSVMWYPVMIFP